MKHLLYKFADWYIGLTTRQAFFVSLALVMVGLAMMITPWVLLLSSS